MRFSFGIILIISLNFIESSLLQENEIEYMEWVLKLEHPHGGSFSENDAQTFAYENKIKFERPLNGLDGFFIYNVNISNHKRQIGFNAKSIEEWNSLFKREDSISKNIIWNSPQIPKRRYYRDSQSIISAYKDNNLSYPNFFINHNETFLNTRDIPDLSSYKDPKFPSQWYIYNDGTNGLQRGNDINVLPVWKRGITGKGVVVSVLDDGVDYTHAEFANIWRKDLAYDFNKRNDDPSPKLPTENHGTRCAGEIVAQRNNKCGIGIAHGAQLTAERVVPEDGIVNDVTEAEALLHQSDQISIYTSSWGPGDDGSSIDGPGELASAALKTGAKSGRNGYGSLYIFASGNGGEKGDNCNFDGYANSIYTIAIGAIMYNGEKPPYGELCAAHLGVMYSSGSGLGILTADLENGCTTQHGGTSAAAPMAAGVIALMLEVRPRLSWRDVQQVLIDSSVQNSPGDSSWHKNGAGRWVSHKFGFGLIDATKAVDAAIRHTLLPIDQLMIKKSLDVSSKIDTLGKTNTRILTTSIVIDHDNANGLSSVEHVTIKVDIQHVERKFLKITLTSPKGTKSVLAEPRIYDKSTEGIIDWKFSTVHSWSESPIGEWVLDVEDVRLGKSDPYNNKAYSTGTVLGWTLNIFGTCSPYDTIVQGDINGPGEGKVCSAELSSLRYKEKIGKLVLFALCSLLLLASLGYLVYKRLRHNSDVISNKVGTSNIVEQMPLRTFNFNSNSAYDYDIESPVREASFQFPNTISERNSFLDEMQRYDEDPDINAQFPPALNISISNYSDQSDIPYEHLSPVISPTRDIIGDKLSQPMFVSNLKKSVSNTNIVPTRGRPLDSPY